MAQEITNEGTATNQVLVWNGARPDWKKLSEFLLGTNLQIYLIEQDDGTYKLVLSSVLNVDSIKITGDDVGTLRVLALTDGVAWIDLDGNFGSTGMGTLGQILTSNGTGDAPTFQDPGAATIPDPLTLTEIIVDSLTVNSSLSVSSISSGSNVVIDIPDNSLFLSALGTNFFWDDSGFGIWDGSSNVYFRIGLIPNRSNGVDLEGEGFPAIRKCVTLSAQTVSISATGLSNTSTTALYRVTVYQQVTTAATAGTLSTTIRWNDGVARSLMVSGIAVTTTNENSDTVECYVTNSSNITYETSLTGVVGSPVYRLVVTAEKLTN